MVNGLRHQGDLVDLSAIADVLSRWAACESPSSDAQAVNRMMDLAVAAMSDVGEISVDRIPGRDGIGDVVLLRAGPQHQRIGSLLIGHLDTVHPIGTAAGPLPIRRDEDRLYGPGLYDMKGGVFCAMAALARAACDGTLTKPTVMLLSPDEEIGSPTTRALIEQLAMNADQALVVEPARSDGAVVTARKGVAWYQFDVQGVPSHAGTHYADGRSAIRGACELILEIEGKTDEPGGTTVSVGKIIGGTARNVVPSQCKFTADVRVTNVASARIIEDAMQSARPRDERLRVTVTGGFNRPPYEKTVANARLLAHAQSVAGSLGISLPDVPMVGGGSDGNFTSALGVATLDGLGVEGGGAHTFDEHCLLSSIPSRIGLLTELLRTPLPTEV
ncbi:glutamate carboxypeptidase [Sphingomonas sp. BK235]|nr:glutamate carboxypeptidase [Sphingomonas sp. BK235]